MPYGELYAIIGEGGMSRVGGVLMVEVIILAPGRYGGLVTSWLLVR